MNDPAHATMTAAEVDEFVRDLRAKRRIALRTGSVRLVIWETGNGGPLVVRIKPSSMEISRRWTPKRDP